MSTSNPSLADYRSLDCGSVAPLLTLRGTGALTDREAVAVERHLATCLACQRDAVLDDVLAAQLRRALAIPLQLAALPSVEEIARAAADEEDDIAEAGEGTDSAGFLAAPHAHPDTARVPRRLSGLSALAAVLVVALLATYIFTSQPGNRTGPVHVSTPPLPTVSPLLAQQTIYLPTSAGIYALRASDGYVRWTYPAGIDTASGEQSQAIVGLSLDHGTLYVLATPPAGTLLPSGWVQLVALNAATGTIRWSVQVTFAGPDDASLVQAGDLLLVVPWYGEVPTAPTYDRTVLAYSTGSGKLVWQHTLADAPVSTPVFANGVVYIGTIGHTVALRSDDGRQLWSTPIIPSAQQQGVETAAANSSVALTVTGNRVYVIAKRPLMLGDSTHSAAWESSFYALSTDDGTHIWRTSIEDDPWATAFPPAISGSMAYVQLGGGITAFSVGGTTPERQWEFIPAHATAANEAMTGAVVSDGIVYTTDLYGVIAQQNNHSVIENFTYALRAGDGSELWRAPTNGGLMAPSPTLVSGLLIAPAGTVLVVLRASDGQRLWTYINPPGGHITVPPILGP